MDARRALGLDAPFGRPGPRLADTSSPLRTPKDSGYYPWTPGDGYPLCTVADRWGVLEVGGTRVTPIQILQSGTVMSGGLREHAHPSGTCPTVPLKEMTILWMIYCEGIHHPRMNRVPERGINEWVHGRTDE